MILEPAAGREQPVQRRVWHVYPEAALLQRRAAEGIARLADRAIAARGEFSIVLAGGSTPRAVYRALRRADTDWSAWRVYFGDERCLPPDHAERNDRMVRAEWLAHVAIPAARVHGIPAEFGPDQGARRYAATLEGAGRFDLVLLGLGEDGQHRQSVSRTGMGLRRRCAFRRGGLRRTQGAAGTGVDERPAIVRCGGGVVPGDRRRQARSDRCLARGGGNSRCRDCAGEWRRGVYRPDALGDRARRQLMRLWRGGRERSIDGDYNNGRRRLDMQIGMIGLGRMGSNMARRLMRDGHQCVVYDRNAEAVATLHAAGAVGVDSLADMAGRMAAPRAIWLMVPATLVDGILAQLVPLLDAGDVVVDGGNSYYRDDLRRAEELRQAGVHYVDVGTSGGVAGLERGYCLMIGGDRDVVRHLDPLFVSLAPGIAAAPRTAGRGGRGGSAEHGYLHCGPTGAGHFVKMVHNGIEYGLMAAYAEGFGILHRANVGKEAHAHDAETTPMRNPEYYQYELDLPEIAEVWRRGSVVASWLLDLTASALAEDGDLGGFSGRVSDSGEGRWTALAAIDEGVPTPVISAALFERFASRGEADFPNRLLSAMRKQFGGHDEKRQGG